MKLGGSSGAVLTAKEKTLIGSDQTGTFFLFVFSSLPQDSAVHQQQPGPAHPGSPRGRGQAGVGDAEGQAWGCAGQECGVSAVDQRTPRGGPTQPRAGAFTAGNRSTAFQKEGFLNPSLTSPPPLPFQSPGNSLMRLDARAGHS